MGRPRKSRRALTAVLVGAILGFGAACSGDTPSDEGRTPSRPACEPGPESGNPLTSEHGRELAMMIVGSAENSSVTWRDAYAYIEYDVEKNSRENRGYTGGIVGFTSKTHDMLDVVGRYVKQVPDGPLAGYLPALRKVNGTASYEGLGPAFREAWKRAAKDSRFRDIQYRRARELYFEPAVTTARQDGLGALGQFAYLDASIVHGTGREPSGLMSIRDEALTRAKPPSAGGDERAYLAAFLDARVNSMKTELAHRDVSRIETAQRVWLNEGNVCLALPLQWEVYGDAYEVTDITRAGP